MARLVLGLLLGMLFIVIIGAYQAQAELGLGGGLGLGVYPLELTGLKEQLEKLGMPPALEGLPDLLPLPHLAARLRLGGLQLALFGLRYEQLLDQETGLHLHVASLAANLEAPLQFQFLLFELGFGLGVDLLAGEVELTAHDAALVAALQGMGLRRLSWLALNSHALGEIALALGPLRLYLLGRYLVPLMRFSQGLTPGNWQLELGLFLTL